MVIGTAKIMTAEVKFIIIQGKWQKEIVNRVEEEGRYLSRMLKEANVGQR